MKKKDFTVTLISNGSEYFYPNNTLTNFTNQLLEDIYLSEDKNWYATLQNIGVHLNYENLGISKDEPLLKAFNGHEFDRKFIELKKSDPLSSPETIASNVITKSSTESLVHVDELEICSFRLIRKIYSGLHCKIFISQTSTIFEIWVNTI